MVPARVQPYEFRRRRQDGGQSLAVGEGHDVVVARVRQQHARQPAGGGDEVEPLEERAQGDTVEAAAVRATPGVGRGASGARSYLSRPASSDAPSAGQSRTSERKSPGCAWAASRRKQPPMLAPRAASHGAPDAVSRRRPAATVSRQPSGPITPSLRP